MSFVVGWLVAFGGGCGSCGGCGGCGGCDGCGGCGVTMNKREWRESESVILVPEEGERKKERKKIKMRIPRHPSSTK